MGRYLFVNFKAYSEATGKNAVLLAKKLESAAKGSEVKVILVVASLDLRAVASQTSLRVFAQHFDFFGQGAFTGSISVEALKEAGAVGSALNHAEKKLGNDFVEKTVLAAKKEKFSVLLCAETIERAKGFCRLAPEFIAFEPPELIGGDISVSTASPGIVKDFAREVAKNSPKTVPLVGAGIKTSLDVEKALEFGAKGVFVASGIVKAKDPQIALKGLLKGFD